MEKEEKKQKNKIEVIEWHDNPNFITNLTITTLVLIIILSQSFAVKNDIGATAILRNLFNHNSIYLVGLLYFIPLKTKTGKKYFNFLNLFLILIYAIFTVTSLLTVVQSFGLTSIVTLGINLILLVYMVHSLLYNTRIWKEFKLEKSPLNEINSINYFYTLIILEVILLTINLIQTSTFEGAILATIVTIYTFFLARFIYLYREYINSNNDKEVSDMNMFKEIDKIRKDFPKLKNVTDEVTKYELNNYQIIALVIMGAGICAGVIFGNVFPTCGTTSNLYSSTCSTTEFNFSLTIVIWFISFLICVMIYGMGHIIYLLDSINKKMNKKK